MDSELSDSVVSVESRPLPVPRGLFVLRYASASDGGAAPEVLISVGPGSSISLLTSSGLSDAVILGAPGQAVPLYALEAGELRIATLKQPGETPREVGMTLEPIVQMQREDAMARAKLQSVRALPQTISIDVLAHVSRRGDILVRDGEWVCGPNFPMAIEGLELRLGSAAPGLDITTSAIVNSRGRKALPSAQLGNFVGTRGKAAPLVGIRLSLSGPAAENCRLLCEALFLGAPVVARLGRSVELSGPTGNEPLVGFRISIEQQGAAEPELLQIPLRASRIEDQFAPEPAEVVGSSRVRVFRATRAKTQQLRRLLDDQPPQQGA